MVFIVLLLSAETSTWEWAKSLGGTGSDEVKGVTCAANGDVIVVGSFSDTVSFGDSTLTSNGSSDILICRYDNYGQELWARSYGSDGSDVAYAVALDSQGNILITGTFTGIVSFDAIQLTANGARDVFVLKLSPYSEVIWAVQGGSTSPDNNSDTGRGICVDELDNVYVTGFYKDTLLWGALQVICNGNTDCFAVKLDSGGNALWLNKAASSGADMAYSIKVKNGLYYIGGSFSTATIAIPPVASLTGSETMSGFYAYGDINTGTWSGGKTIYDTHSTLTGIIEIQDLELDSTGKIIVAGTYNQTNTLGLSVSSTDLFIAKFNTDGTQVWAYRIGSTGAEPGNISICLDASDNIIAAGGFTGTCSFNSQASISTFGGNDAFVVKINSSGQTQWTQRLGGDANDQCFGVAVDNWGYSVVAGVFLSATAYYDANSITSHGSGDIFIGKLDNLQIDFSASQTSGYAPLIVNFINASTGHGPLTYQWDFENDGIIDSNLENPTWVYGVQGFYTVWLTVSDGYATETITKTNLICAIKQPEAVFEWGQSFGTDLNEYCNAVTRDIDGNVYIAGYFTQTIQFGNLEPLVTNGGTDCFVAKLSSNGQWIWSIRNYGGLYNDRNIDIVVDNSGNVYVGGHKQDSAGFYKVFIQKLDSLGGELWIAVSEQGRNPQNTNLTYPQSTYINKIVMGTNGNLYACGFHNYYAKFGSFTTGLNRTTSYSAWICGLSQTSGTWVCAEGIESDNMFVDTNYYINMTDIVLDSSNNLYACVYFNDRTNFYSPVGLLQSNGGYDIIVLKFNSSCSRLWWNRIGTTNSEVATGIAVDDFGNVIITGYFSSSTTFGTITLTGSSNQLFVAKMLPNFTFEWAISTNTSTTTSTTEILKVNSNEFIICGGANGNTYFGDFFLNCNGTDIYVAKFDLEGNWVWAIHGGGTASDYANDMILTSSGAPIICGNIQCPAFLGSISLPYQGGYDGFVAKLETLKADFTADATSGFSPFTVHFTDTSLGFVNYWEWDFDNDGVIDSYEQNPTWTFTEIGHYTVKLIVSDGYATTSATKYQYIHCFVINAEFSASGTTGFIPLQVSFADQTDGPVIDWQWDFNGDGIVDSNNHNQIWTYLFPGVYNVSLTISDGTISDTETQTALVHALLNPAITHYVPQDFPTIQAAIAHCDDGDYIIVADGVYHENLNLLGKSITIASYYIVDGDSTHITNTIINGGNPNIPDEASTVTIIPHNNRIISTPYIIGFTICNGLGRRIIQNIGGYTIEKRVGGGVYINSANPVFIANKIEDNDADDEGGGSYAFQSLPNFGGVVNAAVGIVNPGNNQFYNNHADLGADIYIYGVTTRDAVKVENCGFEVFSAADTTLSNYWANSSVPLSFVGCSGQTTAITSDIYVSTNGSDIVNTGLTPGSPFKTIDYALSRAFGTADNPITIHIASGTYSPSLTGEKYPLQMVKYVSLQGVGQEETFLDAEANADYPGRVLNLDRVEGVSISGLSLMGGFVTLAKNYNGGGIGVIESSVNLYHTLIANCSSAGDGAGIYAYDSSLNADSLNVAYNSALGSGGGFASVQSELSLSNSTIEENSVNKNGAGISADSGILSIQGCSIANNQATGYQSKGGGLAVSNTVNALIRNNQIKHNKADNGAGLYLQGNSELSLDRNQIRNNLADFNGGGLFVNTTTGLITNNLISGNTASQRGGALYCYSSPQIINNTIAYNKTNLQGGGLYLNGAAPSISNSILWANQSGSIPNQLYLFGEAADPIITYCDIQDGQGGIITSPGNSYSGTWENNLDSEPQFVELPLGAGYYFDSGDFALQESSPCIDSGDPNAVVTLFPLDLEGNIRIDNNRIDIGAYEHIFYYGPRIAANPMQISFGRLNINGLQQSLGLSITNTGNQPLQIHSLTWENNPSVFSYEFDGLNQDILPGNSISITLSFLPPAIGSYSINLIINNNSLNQAALYIPVSGIGIDASTSTPGSLSLNVIGDDVQLSWNAVTSDPNGDPYTPDGYIVLYSENADVITDNYFYLDFTEATSYTHNRVAHYRNKMFYRVIAVKDIDRFALISLSASRRQEEPLTWAEVRTKFFGRKYNYSIMKE